jgi:hypothetical protein
MTATMSKVEVRADIWYDGAHLIRYDYETETEVEEGRWVLSIVTPDGEMNWVAKTPATLVAKADSWGAGRGIHVMIKFLTPVGG